MQSLRKIALFAGILAALPLVTSNVFAADYYVAQTAAGSANGSSCANAYAYTWFNTEGNYAAGDTIHLCGTISNPLTVQESGTSANPLKIVFETGAKISMPVCPGGGGFPDQGCLATNGQSNLIIDGSPNDTPCGYVNGTVVPCNGVIENTLNGTSGGTCPGGTCTSQSTSIGLAAPNCPGCEIKNLEIQNIYVRTSKTDTAADPFYEACATISGKGISFHNNICHHSSGGVIDSWLNGDTNVQFYDNYEYSNSHNFVLSEKGSGTTMGSIYYHDNYVNQGSTWDNGLSGGADDGYHESAIHGWGDQGGPNGATTGTVTAFYIYNNKFTNPGNWMSDWILLSQDPDAWTDASGTAYIFNNVMSGSGIGIANGTGHVIANNTLLQTGINIVKARGLTIENNYIGGNGTYQSAGGPTYDQSSTPYAIDYNLYANTWNNNMWDCVSGGSNTWYSSNNLASYLGAGCTGSPEQNSVNDTCAWGGPCTSANEGGVDQTTGIPSSGSDVIGKGINLTSLGITALNSDKNGTARPATGNWDIGAYQYTGALPVPSGLHLVK